MICKGITYSLKSLLLCSVTVIHGVPQGSVVLGPLLFLIHINNLNEAISHSVIHHFADDTNILFSHKSLKKKWISISIMISLPPLSLSLCLSLSLSVSLSFSLFLSLSLSDIVQWLRANRILLNASKTEIILFRPKIKTITKHLNFTLE